MYVCMYESYVMCDLSVWENIKSAICEKTALVQWIRCSPGSHLIHWASAVFSHITLKKYKRCSVFVRYVKIQHLSNDKVFAFTVFIGWVLSFPISHSNEHRLHITSRLFSRLPHLPHGRGTSTCQSACHFSSPGSMPPCHHSGARNLLYALHLCPCTYLYMSGVKHAQYVVQAQNMETTMFQLWYFCWRHIRGRPVYLICRRVVRIDHNPPPPDNIRFNTDDNYRLQETINCTTNSLW